jgi:hypothetical protein
MVLCVVMVLSLSSMAFADNQLPTNPTSKAWPATSSSATAISNAKANLEYIYGTIAADEAIFGGIKTIDSFIGDLTKGLFEGIDDYESAIRNDLTGAVVGYRVLSHDTLVDNAKAYLRGIIGNSINKNLNDNLSSFVTVSKAKYNGENMFQYKDNATGNTIQLRYIGTENGAYVNGQQVNLPATAANSKIYVGTDNCIYGYNKDTGWWYADLYTNPQAWTQMSTYGYSDNDMKYVANYTYDPVKYADAFATAATKALSSEKAYQGLQATIYNLYVLKALDEADDKMDDFYTAVSNWDKDNDILKAYGFNGLGNLFDPYAFTNEFDLPKSINLSSSLFAMGDLDYVDWLP